MLHAENAYFIPDIFFTGTVCRTNLPRTQPSAVRRTAGVAAMENVIEEDRALLGLDPLEVRRRNLYGGAGARLPLMASRRHNTLPARARPAGRDVRLHAGARGRPFNATSRTFLRGLALTPVKFGISFTRRTLNQGIALVNIYLDGTVQVSTGGTEMGQGLNTKIRQLVADAFAIPIEGVRVMPTSTEKNNNTSPTAASASTDLNGAAALRAGETIRRRLAPVAAQATRRRPAKGSHPTPDHRASRG